MPLGPPAAAAPLSGAHYWMDPCANYATSNYSRGGLGCDRTSAGTGMADLYESSVAVMFSNVSTCPQELLLWFHHLPWDHPMPSPSHSRGGDARGTNAATATVPLFDWINATHHAAVGEAGKLASAWDTLEGLIDTARFEGVRARFAQQVNDAGVFRDTIVNYYTQLAERGGGEGSGTW